MASISAELTREHRQCDELFARAEERIARGDWAQAMQAFSEFTNAMERHFHFEEDSLFPAFEQASGSRAGPTQMMRMEHEQMRALFRDLQAGLQAQEAGRCLGLSETLLILMQQHNLKEEHMLYRLAEQALGPAGAALAAQRARS
jgi:hemerythrin-like domain-containing protein